ncbi:sporulation sigma-E factor-processing peptidase [Alicyclobacillus cellulosilyticus]|uniref:Sporulation sigma-E factor-processing peptidase n=1 Tax=Alicyclobacillus cellulosilyticus TaxID=1003997 RepID=A0A917K289_9BACL|nr:sporulation sigma-E factor-processing peptidase [Alicyclobacillus cellulosilyticus]
MPVVYIDVVWLVNFAMDAVLLAVTGWILRRTVRPWRVLLGALAGSVYALSVFFPTLSLLTTWPGKAAASLLMVAIALPWRRSLDLARNAAVFYMVSFLCAGAAIAIHFALPAVSVAQGTVVAANRLAFLTSLGSLSLIVACPVAWAGIRLLVRHLRMRAWLQATACTVHVVVAGKEVVFTGLLDTGNRLYDPISRRPVCLVEAEALAPVLPPALAAAETERWLEALSRVDDAAWRRRLAVVPYRGAGGTQQVTVAVRPDEVRITCEGRSVRAGPCLLALHPNGLSLDRHFQAILHTDLIMGDDGIEDAVEQHEDDVAPALATDVDSSAAEARGRQRRGLLRRRGRSAAAAPDPGGGGVSPQPPAGRR